MRLKEIIAIGNREGVEVTKVHTRNFFPILPALSAYECSPAAPMATPMA